MIICRLRKILEKRGWSQYKLHKESHVTYPTITSMFHGRTERYSADVLNKICYALKCRPGDLLKWRPDEVKKTRLK